MKQFKLPKDQNSVLSFLTFITSLGDFVSLFAMIVYVSKSSSLLLAAYLVPIKSLGIVFGALTVPNVLNRINIRNVIIISQLFSFITLLALTISTYFEFNNPYIFLIASFIISFFKQWFDNSRETASHALGNNSSHNFLQAQILHGFFGAQFLGPIISLLFIYLFPIYISLAFDSVTFIIATSLALHLRTPELSKEKKSSILRPFSYLSKNKSLFYIFMLRSIGYWIPIGIANYLLFIIVEQQYNLRLENSAVVYSLIGFGSIASTYILKSSLPLFNFLKSTPEAKIAFAALVILAFSRIGFASSSSFLFASIFITVGGICNGFNACSTQSLRRKFSTSSELKEIIGLETVVGRFFDWVSGSITAFLLSTNIITYTSGIYISSLGLIILAFFHLSKTILPSEKINNL